MYNLIISYSKIGSGAFGEVFSGLLDYNSHKFEGRDVAIKVTCNTIFFIYLRLDKNVGFSFVNDPCLQNPCTRLVAT
jgi:hypothetical protein